MSDHDMTRKYIAELEKKIERLERHNARFNPDYDPERDSPLDDAWESGNKTAWLDMAAHALSKLDGLSLDPMVDVVRLEQERGEIKTILRHYWEDSGRDEPFPDELYLPDILRLILE